MPKVPRVAGLALAAVLNTHSAYSQDRAVVLERLVKQDCGSCHGMTLKGGLGPDLLPGRLANMPTDVLAATILDGRPGTPMPPWRGLLSEEDARWIANRLKTEPQQ